MCRFSIRGTLFQVACATMVRSNHIMPWLGGNSVGYRLRMMQYQVFCHSFSWTSRISAAYRHLLITIKRDGKRDSEGVWDSTSPALTHSCRSSISQSFAKNNGTRRQTHRDSLSFYLLFPLLVLWLHSGCVWGNNEPVLPCWNQWGHTLNLHEA